MAVPSYEELLARHEVDSSVMEQTFSDDHLMKFARQLDKWEILASSLKLPNTDIESIKSTGGIEVQRYQLMKCWKERCGSMATYEALVKVLLEINRTDLAEKIVSLPKSLRDTTQSSPSPSETSMATPTSPASSSGLDYVSPVEVMKETLQNFEEEFLELVIYIEDTLESSKINLNTIIRRFSMLPQSVKRRHETDESYKETR